MNGNHDLEKRLRATLRARAGDAPSGDGVAERVLAEVAGPPAAGPPRRRWGTWAMPLLAAAAVVAVIASVLTVSHSNNTAAPARPSSHGTHTESSTQADVTPTSAAPPPPPVYKVTSPHPAKWDKVGGGQLIHFQAGDATFLGTNQAWLLGTADCITGRVQPPCNAMVRTDDGGRTWQSVQPPGRFAHIRFANPSTGYAFSPSDMKMMVDGKGWISQPGGAVALETLDGDVIRVAQTDPSCTGVCSDFVETSAVGSSSWHRSTLQAFRARAVQLQRTHGHAFLLARTGTKTSLFSSNDGGVNWQPQADWCTKLGSGFAATSMAVGAVGTSLHLLCRGADDRWAIVSNRQRGTLPAGVQRYPRVELGAADQNTLFVVADRLYRSADGGHTWHSVMRYPPKGDLGPPEFQNGTVGRWFTDGGRVVWKTTNAGRTWHGVSFSS